MYKHYCKNITNIFNKKSTLVLRKSEEVTKLLERQISAKFICCVLVGEEKLSPKYTHKIYERFCRIVIKNKCSARLLCEGAPAC